MKFAAILVLLCFGTCLADKDATITTWGNVNAREFGRETALIKSSIWQVKTHYLTFPKYPTAATIVGIKHLDYKSHPVAVKFQSGDIGSHEVTLKIDSQRGHGINSTFVFYTL